jgi:hypothetical protein
MEHTMPSSIITALVALAIVVTMALSHDETSDTSNFASPAQLFAR